MTFSHCRQRLQGNCTKEPPTVAIPPRLTKRQCILDVREDFLEVSGPTNRLLLADLYIQLGSSGSERMRANSLMLHVAEGGMYIVNVTLKGDGKASRGVDVGNGALFFAAGASTVLLPV
jgi:hypothetical protein